MLKKTDIKYLFCSHRSFLLENLLYTACRLSKVESIAWDFSLGYPFENIYKKEISLTTKPDKYIVNSTFRQEQYKNANKDYINSGNRLEIVNLNCIQVQYARKLAKDYKNISYPSRNIVVSLFDNNYGENSGLSFKFADELALILSNYRNKLSCIVHSKINRKYLENVLSKRNININKAPKGDFSLAKKCDLIISIGFQGSAIKAAFAFNKPMIFFVPDRSYFDNMNFANDIIYNKKTINIFRKLIFSNIEIQSLFSKNKSPKELNEIQDLTNQFLELVGISHKTKNISQYRTILAEKISSLPNVASTSTFVSMETVKD